MDWFMHHPVLLGLVGAGVAVAWGIYLTYWLLQQPAGNDRMREISAWQERWREMQITALNFVVREHGLDASEFPPAGIAVVIAAIGRTLILEQALGTSGGHDEAIAEISRILRHGMLK